MKEFNPPQQLLDFDLVLKYDTEQTPILSYTERRQIIYAKARTMRGEETSLEKNLKEKIEFTLAKISNENWTPKNPIKYGKTF